MNHRTFLVPLLGARLLSRAIARIMLGASLLLGIPAWTASPAMAADGCQGQVYEGNHYTVCSFDLAETDLRLFWRDADGRPYRSFSALADALKQQDSVLAFAMNAGMFQTDFTPLGLYLENGRLLRRANTTSIPANSRSVPNFYRKPNGVFYIHGHDAAVTTTEAFLSSAPEADYATQSGPLLVIDGQLHPDFIKDSTDRTRRTGVGVSGPGMVHFVISEDAVNFYDFAHFFLDGLGCGNALFLDGGRGTGLYSPQLGRNDISWHGGFGPIVAAVQ